MGAGLVQGYQGYMVLCCDGGCYSFVARVACTTKWYVKGLLLPCMSLLVTVHWLCIAWLCRNFQLARVASLSEVAWFGMSAFACATALRPLTFSALHSSMAGAYSLDYRAQRCFEVSALQH